MIGARTVTAGKTAGLGTFLRRMGDSCLVLGHRVSEWCGHAPALEDDIAMANVALDLIGQTRLWLGLAGRGGGQGLQCRRPRLSPGCRAVPQCPAGRAAHATRTDSWIDIEGGIGTFLTYASKGRRELPNTHLLLDGEPDELSRDQTFSGQHVLSALEGVAVHINAFNFPCWGILQKLAPTLLAGMPAIVKPASQTAYLTELMVRRIIETGLLPEGALQLISGPVGDLLDRVACQDVVTFTGSAATGRMLKAHPAIVDNAVRFTMEADSLNAAILGPDARPDSEEFDLFVREVVREVTVKAGQKCTAIRRVFAPRAYCDDLIDALSARLGKTTVGDPCEEGTRMGPLASTACASWRRSCRAIRSR